MELIDKLHRTLGTTGLVITSATTLLVGAIYSYHLHLSTKRSGEAPINWSWLPILGDAIELGTRPLEFLAESSAKNEDIFGIVVAGQRMFIISDPHSSHLILKPTKSFSWEEFHQLVLMNFFGATDMAVVEHSEQLMRKWYSTYILR